LFEKKKKEREIVEGSIVKEESLITSVANGTRSQTC